MLKPKWHFLFAWRFWKLVPIFRSTQLPTLFTFNVDKDWSIDYYLTSNEQYFSFRTRTSSIIYKNYIVIREGMNQTGKLLLIATEKVWRGGQGRKMCSGYNASILFRHLQRERGTLKTLYPLWYDPQLGFQYYNLITPPSRGLLLSAARARTEECGMSRGLH